MEAKKISFGFSKINKKPSLLPKKENASRETKVELIKCLEGQEIKLVEETPEEQPLIIPLKESHKTSAALASLMKRRAVLLGEEELEDNDYSVKPSISTNNEVFEDIEKRAARELLADIQKKDSTDPANNLVLPVVKPEDLPLEGSKEPTLDDYESVPIQDFGKAMLRGMGWTEPLVKTNKKGGLPIDDTPMVRPKGMGLGADKALKKKTLLVAPEANEVLEIKRNAYVLILGGKHKDLYGQIEGFDDHAGRVIVKMAIGGAKEAFNEFLCQAVSRKEYAQYGKCINTSKYEEYKKKETEYDTIMLDKNEREFIDKNENIKKERHGAIKDEHQNSDADFGRNRKKEDYIEDKPDIKSKSDLSKEEQNGSNNRDKEYERWRANDKYDGANSNRDREGIQETTRENKDRRNEGNRDGVRDYRRKYDDRERKGYRRDDDRYRQRENDKYESKSNYPRSHMFRRNEDDDYKKRNARECEKADRDVDRQRERKRESSQYKTFELDGSSNSKNNSYSSKHKKSKKANLKKKSKSKKRYKSKSSDIETSSSSLDSSSDFEEAKFKKHKKRTKKSKRQRERSRSRGRR